MKIEIGEYFELSNGNFCKVLNISHIHIVKIRIIRRCVGEYSTRKRIGKPYTYQYTGFLYNFEKRIKRKIGGEEILNLLFNSK